MSKGNNTMYLYKHLITEDTFLTNDQELADYWKKQGERFVANKLYVMDSQHMVTSLIEQVNEEYEQHRE